MLSHSAHCLVGSLKGLAPGLAATADLDQVGGCSNGVLEGVALAAQLAVQVPVLPQVAAAPHVSNGKDHAPACQRHISYLDLLPPTDTSPTYIRRHTAPAPNNPAPAGSAN